MEITQTFTISYSTLSILSTSLLVFVAVLWGLNKALEIFKGY